MTPRLEHPRPGAERDHALRLAQASSRVRNNHESAQVSRWFPAVLTFAL